MAITPLDRFGGPSIYAPVYGVRRETPTAAARAVDAGTTDPRPVAPVDPRTVADPPAIESLTSSARAATIALAAAPRAAFADIESAQDAAADVEDAALAAQTDPLQPPTSREVAANFAAVAALVPTPQLLVNDTAISEADEDVSSPVATADDRSPPEQRFDPQDFAGARLSRYA